MTKWEYYNTLIIGPSVDSRSHSARMTELGAQGWELVNLHWNDSKSSYRMFFKRPLVEPPPFPRETEQKTPYR